MKIADEGSLLLVHEFQKHIYAWSKLLCWGSFVQLFGQWSCTSEQHNRTFFRGPQHQNTSNTIITSPRRSTRKKTNPKTSLHDHPEAEATRSKRKLRQFVQYDVREPEISLLVGFVALRLWDGEWTGTLAFPGGLLFWNWR